MIRSHFPSHTDIRLCVADFTKSPNEIKETRRAVPISPVCIGESRFRCSPADVSQSDPENHPCVLNSTSATSTHPLWLTPPTTTTTTTSSPSPSSSSSDTSSWQLAPFNSLQHSLGLVITGVLQHRHHTCPLTGGTVPSGTSGWGTFPKRVSSYVSKQVKGADENRRRRRPIVSSERFESSRHPCLAGARRPPRNVSTPRFRDPKALVLKIIVEVTMLRGGRVWVCAELSPDH